MKVKEKLLDKIIDFLSTPSFYNLGLAVDNLKCEILKVFNW